jgi:hypothetical protein
MLYGVEFSCKNLLEECFSILAMWADIHPFILSAGLKWSGRVLVHNGRTFSFYGRLGSVAEDRFLLHGSSHPQRANLLWIVDGFTFLEKHWLGSSLI